MTRAEALQAAKPILFNTEMVRAIQGGIKTVTRRIVKPQPANPHREHIGFLGWNDGHGYKMKQPCEVGDILYVRETFYQHTHGYCEYIFKADYLDTVAKGMYWRPSIHMPKEAARIFLRVTGVRVERLQDIITGDYKTPLNINREGLISPCSNCTHHNGDCKDFISDNTCRLVNGYITLWNSTIQKNDLAKYGWDANPWVRVIEFERMEVTE